MQVRSDIDVALAGGAESTRMSGSIDVTAARYTRPIQLFSLGTTAASPSSDPQLPGIEADWARSVLLDVEVNADRTIVIDNNLFTGTLSAYLTIGGNAAVPRPTGRVFTDVGTVRLPSARLEVEELELHSPAETASAPQLRLIATTQVQGYAMNVTVSGSVPSVEVRIVSSPRLPTDEAILLLTTGTRRSDLSFTPNVSGTLTALGAVFGRQILSQLPDQIADEDRRFIERIEFEIERERETGRIGEIGVEYQLGDEERWFLLFNRKTEESYTLQLAWRLWLD